MSGHPWWVYVTAAAFIPWMAWVVRIVFFTADDDEIHLPPFK